MTAQKIHRSTFMNEKSQLFLTEELGTSRTASVRIRLERAIQRIENYEYNQPPSSILICTENNETKHSQFFGDLRLLVKKEEVDKKNPPNCC